jgi:aspartate/methionine/tyrosine aminotransferase
MTREQQRHVLEHCRRRGIWIVADEVYERLYYRDGAAAPSFLDLADRHERVLCVNSFSKAWLMTGWRLGWIVAPAGLMPELEKLLEYNTSCAPDFIQHAGVAAVRDGAAIAQGLVGELGRARDHLLAGLNALPGLDVKAPDGAMYVFFRLPAMTDSLETCMRLVREAGLGLAPGSAFGEEGEGFVRWCYACGLPRLDEGLGRLRTFLGNAAV